MTILLESASMTIMGYLVWRLFVLEKDVAKIKDYLQAVSNNIVENVVRLNTATLEEGKSVLIPPG